MNNLFDTIATFDNVAKSNAFRSIANSCLAQAIGQIRQSIRDRIGEGEWETEQLEGRSIDRLRVNLYPDGTLVEVRLWVPDRTGWRIPNWPKRQQSSAETAEIVAKRSAAGKKGNCARWHSPGCTCWSDD